MNFEVYEQGVCGCFLSFFLLLRMFVDPIGCILQALQRMGEGVGKRALFF